MKALHIILAGQHPTVQISALPPGDAGVMAGIDKIRSNLKWRDFYAATLECGQKSKGYGCFAASALGAGYDESFVILKKDKAFAALNDEIVKSRSIFNIHFRCPFLKSLPFYHQSQRDKESGRCL